MNSIFIPSDIQLSISTGFIKREGPRGTILKKTGNLVFSVISCPEGNRLFVRTPNTRSTFQKSNNRSSLSSLAARNSRREGLSRGVRRRLRLVGVGFRATLSGANTSNSTISLKLGYSHEVKVPIGTESSNPIIQGFQVQVKPSRLEGRSKGTLLSLEGRDRASVHQVAARLRKYRLPDSYKGKGIQYDKETLILKKGKREN